MMFWTCCLIGSSIFLYPVDNSIHLALPIGYWGVPVNRSLPCNVWKFEKDENVSCIFFFDKLKCQYYDRNKKNYILFEYVYNIT